MEFYGVVKDIRSFKWGGFFLLETFDQGIDSNSIIQCVIKDNLELFNNLKHESYVHIIGELKSANVKKELVNSNYEILVESIKILSSPTIELPFNIYEKDLNVLIDTNLNNRHLSLRNEKNKSVFKIQSILHNEFRNFLDIHNFISISTPKLVANGAEGGTNVFKLDYFGKEAYLAQSPQLYKQMMCGVFGNVYETGPVFRAETFNTSRHVNEYISLDLEMVIKKDFYELIEVEKLLINSMINEVNIQGGDLLKFLNVELPDYLNIKNALTLKVSEIKTILGTSGDDLSGEDEIEICRYAKEKYNTDFVFSTHYHRDARPFYTKLSGDGITTESFDLLYKGMEITSGGQRSEQHSEYISRMKEKNMNLEPFKEYLETFALGMPLHGGFAIGLERLTAKLCNIDSVKLATLFPRDVDRLTP